MGKGLAITGFVLSIVGLVCCFVFFYISLPCSIVGLILSVVGGKKLKANNMPHGLATAGMVLGIIAISLSAVMTACGICAVVTAGEIAKDIANGINGSL